MHYTKEGSETTLASGQTWNTDGDRHFRVSVYWEGRKVYVYASPPTDSYGWPTVPGILNEAGKSDPIHGFDMRLEAPSKAQAHAAAENFVRSFMALGFTVYTPPPPRAVKKKKRKGPSEWQKFLQRKLKQGYSMQDAAAEWRAKKNGWR